MGFMNIPEPPPENGEFITAYNELIKQCWLRGFGDMLETKLSGDSLKGEDMDALREQVDNARQKLFYDPSQMKLDEDDPFTPPKINGGKGFLLVTANLSSTGKRVYDPNPAFGKRHLNPV